MARAAIWSLPGARPSPRSWMQRRQRAKLFSDDQRRVVGQHDATGADPDAAGAVGHMRQRHCGGCAGNARHVMVFGHPIPGIANGLGTLRKVA